MSGAFRDSPGGTSSYGKLWPCSTRARYHNGVDRFTLRFLDPMQENGFAHTLKPQLCHHVAHMMCTLCFVLVVGTLSHRFWDVSQYHTTEAYQLSRWQMLFFFGPMLTLIIALGVGRLLAKNQIISTLVLEILVVFECICFVMIWVILPKHYIARAFGYDDTEAIWGMDLGGSDGSVLLWIDGIVTALHLLLPIRWMILVPMEVVAVLAYPALVLLLGSPSTNMVPYNILGLLVLTILAAIGKRSIEMKERLLFLGLLAEKEMRCRAEFQLSQSEFELSQHVPQSRARGSPSELSRPSTTDTGLKFMMLGDSSVQELVPLGEREQWLIGMEEIVFDGAPLGEGGFGKVWSGLYQGHPVAVKVPKDRSYEGSNTSQVTQLCNEVRILRKLRHPNIVFFYGACIGGQQAQVALVLELVAGCSLRQFILFEQRGQRSLADDDPELPAELERAHLIAGTTSALRYLHSRKPRVVHGDLKDSNVFVERGCCPRRPPAAKLLDFGLSRALTRSAKPLGGTRRWVAPEVYRGSSPDTAADVFSFGCLALFIATGQRPAAAGSGQSEGPAVPPSRPPGDWLAGACERLAQECCSAEASQRPRAEHVHRQAEGWLEALRELGEVLPARGPAGDGERSASGPRADAVAPLGSSPPGAAGAEETGLSLLLPEYRRTHEATVDAMVFDFLLSCNVEVPAGSCCHFHAALSRLSRTVAGHASGPCRPWSLEATTGGQCAGCGLLLHKAQGCEGSASCTFCDVSLESDSRGSRSLTVIAEAVADDET